MRHEEDTTNGTKRKQKQIDYDIDVDGTDVRVIARLHLC